MAELLLAGFGGGELLVLFAIFVALIALILWAVLRKR